MSNITLGIIGGGQLGSMLAIAAKKLGIKIIIFCDDLEAPAQNFCDEFIYGGYDDKQKILDNIDNYKFGKFIPPSFNKDVLVYGLHGGAQWPGGVFDPYTQNVYVHNINT